MTCVSCLRRVDHCHGTLVRHTEGAVECTDAACTEMVAVRHDLIIDCHEVEGGCGCDGALDAAAADYADLPRAS